MGIRSKYINFFCTFWFLKKIIWPQSSLQKSFSHSPARWICILKIKTWRSLRSGMTVSVDFFLKFPLLDDISITSWQYCHLCQVTCYQHNVQFSQLLSCSLNSCLFLCTWLYSLRRNPSKVGLKTLFRLTIYDRVVMAYIYIEVYVCLGILIFYCVIDYTWKKKAGV